MRCASTCTQQIISAATKEEWAPPGGVIAGLCDVLAGDPDRVAIDSRCTIITPARAQRINLRFVAGKAVGSRLTLATRNIVPGTNADKGIDRRVGGAWVERIACSG